MTTNAYLSPGVWVVEHKTANADIGPGTTYWKRLVLDGQVSTYLPGTRALGHADVRGVLYDVIRKPTIRPLKATPVEQREYTKPRDKACPECKKKKQATPAPHQVEIARLDKDVLGDELGEPVYAYCHEGRVVTDPGGKLYASMRENDETPEEFRARLRSDIGANPEKYYQRGTVVRLVDEEKDAAFDAWSVAGQIRESQLSGRWPRNVDACDTYGSFCAYWPVCAGEATIEDDARYRNADEHEELEGAKVEQDADPETAEKRRLPLVTSSSLKAYRSCARKYFHAYEQRRRPVQTSDALRFGTLMHKGLEVWWSTCDLALALEAMAGEADPFERVKAEELMLGYHVMWSEEPLEVLAVESEFVAPLVNPETGRASRTWARGGKIDALVRVQ